MLKTAHPLRLSAILAATLIASFSCGRRTPRPNVILVSIDCLNQRQLEQALRQSSAPNIARLAAEALVFERAYSHAPWTTPSHMSMLTGLYPSQHGRDIPFGPMIRFNDGYDRVPLFRTLPELLAAAGYETVAFVGKGSISAEFGLGQGFSLYHESSRDNPARSDLPETQARLQEWLTRRAPKPFFLFYHTYDLHYPLPKDRRPWDVALNHIDRHLGELFSLLEQHGLYGPSLIILTGDHGSDMIRNEEKCCVHGAGHYEENLHVPLVVKPATRGEPGRRGMLVRHVDILPTVLDAVGLPLREYRGPGSSILGRDGERATRSVASFSEADGRCVARRAMVDDRYKYIQTPDDFWRKLLRRSPLFDDELCRQRPACDRIPREELYDLAMDPFEEHNLLDRPLTPDARAAMERLRAQLVDNLNLPSAYRTTLGRASRREEGAQPDESVEDALRALGYVR
jgi:arylsulfatase A-like enzyme